MEQAATATQPDDLTAGQRLLALRALSTRRQRLEHQLKSQKLKWRERLDELSRALHDLIEEQVPAKPAQCKNSLVAIQEAYEARRTAVAEKKADIDATTTKIAAVDAAMYEMIHAEPGSQMDLELGGDPDEGGPRWLTSDTGRQVSRAIADLGDDDASADMADLRARLDELGVAGLTLAPEAGDEDEDEDDDDRADNDSPDG